MSPSIQNYPSGETHYEIFSPQPASQIPPPYAWRLSAPTLASFTPQGTAYLLKWTVPDGGFTPQSSSTLNGTWNDAGISYIYTQAGTNRFGAVPAASLPVGNAAFFRLINTNAP